MTVSELYGKSILFTFLNLRNILRPVCSKCCSYEDLYLSNCVQIKLTCVKSLFVESFGNVK